MQIDDLKENSKWEQKGISQLISADGNEKLMISYLSWNGKQPVYDIRVWREKDGKVQATKGIILNDAEVKRLRDILNKKEDIKEIFADTENQL